MSEVFWPFNILLMTGWEKGLRIPILPQKQNKNIVITI